MLKRGLWFASAHNLLFLGKVGANIEIQASGRNRGRPLLVLMSMLQALQVIRP